tara:strand:+ start:1099 stop:1542 length:444 start_codon:yes stop_codon:yes gene_type:complete
MKNKYLHHFPVKGLVPFVLANYLEQQYIKVLSDNNQGKFKFKDYTNFLGLSFYEFLFQLSEFKIIRAFLKLFLMVVLLTVGFLAHKLLSPIFPLRTISFNINAKNVSNIYKQVDSEIVDLNRKKNNVIFTDRAYKNVGGNVFNHNNK